MVFVSVRDLRGKSAEVWRRLGREREIVVTSNGKPLAILSAVDESILEESLIALRRARAMAAVASLQARSVDRGTHRIPAKTIEAEIARVRRARPR